MRSVFVFVITDNLKGSFHQSKFNNLEIKILFWIFLLPACCRVLDDVLAVVHGGDLFGGGGVLRLLVVPDPDEPREPEADPFTGVNPAQRRPVDGRNAEVGALDLPHLHRLEPVVRLVAGVVAVVGFGLVSQILFEEGGVGGEVLIREAGADLADALILLILRVVAGEKEATIAKGRHKLNS